MPNQAASGVKRHMRRPSSEVSLSHRVLSSLDEVSILTAKYAFNVSIDEAYREGQAAYERGDHIEAKRQSDLRKKFTENVHKYNAKASDIIYMTHNPNSTKLDTIDLHGLFEEEAKSAVSKHIERCKKANIHVFNVVVGKGLHSHNGIPKLKYAIQELVEQHHLRCTVNPQNSGVLIVEFVTKERQGIFGWIQSGCIIC